MIAMLLVAVAFAAPAAEKITVKIKWGDVTTTTEVDAKSSRTTVGSGEPKVLELAADDSLYIREKALALPHVPKLPDECARDWIEVTVEPADSKTRKTCLKHKTGAQPKFREFAESLRRMKMLNR